MNKRTGRRGVAMGTPGQPGGDDNREHAPVGEPRGRWQSPAPGRERPAGGR